MYVIVSAYLLADLSRFAFHELTCQVEFRGIVKRPTLAKRHPSYRIERLLNERNTELFSALFVTTH